MNRQTSTIPVAITPRRTVQRLWRSYCGVTLLALACACGSDEPASEESGTEGMPDKTANVADSGADSKNTAPDTKDDRAPDAESTQKSECGDARVDSGEECDDGNDVDDDECSKECKKIECGNDRKDPGEECDDGNDVDDDECSKACKKIECGNDRKDPGEDCDGEPNCAACKKLDDKCTSCEEMHCRDYLGAGIDWVDGCLSNKPNSMYVKDAPEKGEYSEPCKAILACARESKCVTATGDTAADACYCGSADPETCLEKGPAEDAACGEQFFKAAKTTVPAEAAVRLQDPSYASGYAYYLLACDAEFCKAECAPWLK